MFDVIICTEAMMSMLQSNSEIWDRIGFRGGEGDDFPTFLGLPVETYADRESCLHRAKSLQREGMSTVIVGLDLEVEELDDDGEN